MKQFYQAKQEGFTLIELMIVVALIAIIASIAIPNLLRSRMASNESAAAGNVRTISTGEVGFKQASFVDPDGDGDGDYGTLAQLSNPDGAGATEPFIDVVLGSGNKLGYTYTLAVTPGGVGGPSSYTCIAVPTQPGKSGYRQFFVDETGVIRFTADGTAVSSSSTAMN